MPFEGSLEHKSVQDNPQNRGESSGPLTEDELHRSNWRRLGDVAQRLVNAATDKRGGE